MVKQVQSRELYSAIDADVHREAKKRTYFKEVANLFDANSRPPTIVLYSPKGKKGRAPEYNKIVFAVMIDPRHYLHAALEWRNFFPPRQRDILTVARIMLHEDIVHEYSHHMVNSLFPVKKIDRIANSRPKKTREGYLLWMDVKDEAIAEFVTGKLSFTSPPWPEVEETHLRFTQRANKYHRNKYRLIKALSKEISERDFPSYVKSFLSINDIDNKVFNELFP